MNNFEPNEFSTLSAENILQELEDLIKRVGTPWIKATKLRRLFYNKNKLSLDEVIQEKENQSLKNFLFKTKRFSIYNNYSQPEDFYVACFSDVIPYSTESNLSQHPNHRIKYRIKRSWRVDGRLLEMLKSQEYEEIQNNQNFQGVNKLASFDYNPPFIDEIKSAGDLKFILWELIKDLTSNQSQKCITIGELIHCFYTHYHRPLRSIIIRTLSLEIEVIDFLKNMKNLSVEKVDDDWQVSINIES